MQSSATVSFMIKKKKKKQELLAREPWIIFQVSRTELSKEPEPVLSMSNMSEIAACPLSPVAKDP